jgi:MinD-like ATPase involved in chromosome partitioning or flagellar assembly
LNGIETIPSFLHPSDAINISENDIFNLILLLSPIYDRIVFDLDVELSPRVLAVFNNCDELIEVMQDHESGINKHLQLMSILKDINVSQKHKIYISRHYTALFDDIEYLTEVREWYKLQI